MTDDASTNGNDHMHSVKEEDDQMRLLRDARDPISALTKGDGNANPNEIMETDSRSERMIDHTTNTTQMMDARSRAMLPLANPNTRMMEQDAASHLMSTTQYMQTQDMTSTNTLPELLLNAGSQSGDEDDHDHHQERLSKKRRRSEDLTESQSERKKRKGMYMCNVCHQEKKGHICSKVPCTGNPECRSPWKHTPHGRRARWQTSKGKHRTVLTHTHQVPNRGLRPSDADVHSPLRQVTTQIASWPVGVHVPMGTLHQASAFSHTTHQPHHHSHHDGGANASAMSMAFMLPGLERNDVTSPTDPNVTGFGFRNLEAAELVGRGLHDTHMVQPAPAVTSKPQLIIDTAGGVDDAAALLLALTHRDNAEICAILTVFGKVHLPQSAANVARVLELFPGKGPEIPIFRGSDGPIVASGTKPVWEGYGSNGLGDCRFSSPPKTPRQPEHAVTALLRMINEKPGAFTMVLLGAMTNLALAVRLDPGIAHKLKSIVFMGGTAYGKGNATMTSEQNIFADPEAAHIVLQSFGAVNVPIYMVSWETTVECGLEWQWYDKWIKIGRKNENTLNEQCQRTAIRDFLFCTTRKYEQTYRNITLFNMCASVAMAIALCPMLAKEIIPSFVTVELGGICSRGSTVVDWHNRQGLEKNVCLVTDVNKNGLRKMWEEMLLYNVEGKGIGSGVKGN
eukprot:TRINITY_DN6570_c0_g1_i1.p1 TRINITY_DN6570_c0_g1~~TRINITY_DN6570_c0_g1_i1.p1  ORF type:complete len:741 (-),score=82.47 TRINITY_DN6570_c0_g1_i1:67-2106(-)